MPIFPGGSRLQFVSASSAHRENHLTRGYNFFRTFAMSQAPQAVAAPPSPSAETPLAAHLRSAYPELQLVSFQGALTPQAFTGAHPELAALTQSAGIYDLGYSAFLEITGGDQLRWLNGMVTNAIQSLEAGHWNYSLLLNAQGRIQGDANIYRFPNRLLFQSDRSQIARQGVENCRGGRCDGDRSAVLPTVFVTFTQQAESF